MKPPARRQGLTTPSRAQHGEPRLPHERDESSDSQAEGPPDAQRIGEQAAQDLRRGLPDTDRAPVTDRLYQRLFRRR